MRIVFMGTSEFAIPCLEHLRHNQYEIIAVYTQPDRPAGRGRPLASSPVKRAAMAHNLTVVQPVNLKSVDTLAQLAGLSPDVIVVAAFGQILPPSVLDLPRYGCLNVHPSLLPSFRGASPVAAAILAGDDFTGVSIMLMDKGLDTGPVLARAQVPIFPWATTGLLMNTLSQIAARLLTEVLPRWLRGQLFPQPQNEGEATYSTPISNDEGMIDWYLPAIDLWRRVRAFNPWPGSYTVWEGKRLKIIEAVPLPGEKTAEVGRVIALTSVAGEAEAAFGVNTGEGILGVLKVQLEGKRAISSAEFLRGQRQFIGTRLH